MDLTKQPTICEVIEKAAQHLPIGWILCIKIEKDGYDVEIEHPDGNSVSVDGGEGIISDINEAICVANGFIG